MTIHISKSSKDTLDQKILRYRVEGNDALSSGQNLFTVT